MTMRDHPGDFNNNVGSDLYMNPWWGLRSTTFPEAARLAHAMNDMLGQPDLWFQGLFHELLWGPRHLPRSWRPGFHVNLSGPQGGVIYRSFWLPWRASGASYRLDDDINKWVPYACNVLDSEVRIEDLGGLQIYAEIVNRHTLPATVGGV